ncbi:MAG: hypothetical protein RJB66_1794 [Pseudomonadota bacterium]
MLTLKKSRKRLKNYMSVFLSLLFVNPLAWSCDPNQDCMSWVRVPCPTWKYPARSCMKRIEDVLCSAARKVCQKDCKSINQDANSYIFGFRGESERIKNEVSTIEAAIVSEIQHGNHYAHLVEEFIDSLAQTERAGSNALLLLTRTLPLETFFQENQLFDSPLAQVIELAKKSPDAQIQLMGALLERSQELESRVFEVFETEGLVEALQLMVIVFKQEAQKLRQQISATNQIRKETEHKRVLLEAIRKQREGELRMLDSNINKQEMRKCTPW